MLELDAAHCKRSYGLPLQGFHGATRWMRPTLCRPKETEQTSPSREQPLLTLSTSPVHLRQEEPVST